MTPTDTSYGGNSNAGGWDDAKIKDTLGLDGGGNPYDAYTKARSNGLTSEQIGNAYGVAGADIDKWTQQQGLGKLDGVASPNVGYQNGANPYMPVQSIGSTWDSKAIKGWYDASPDNQDPTKIYQAAQKYGVTADQIDAAFGFDAGASAKWIQSQGYGALDNKAGGASIQDIAPAAIADAQQNFNAWKNSGSAKTTLPGGSTLTRTPDGKVWIDAKNSQGGSNVQEVTDANFANVVGGLYLSSPEYRGYVSDKFGYTANPNDIGLLRNNLNMNFTPADPKNYRGNPADGGGLIGSRMGGDGRFEPLGSSSSGDKALMANQMNDILNPNSQLMQSAMARATAAANSRGLSNSSMAVQAGQEAMLSAASDIAKNDAQTWLQRERDKMANTLDYDKLRTNQYQFGLNYGLDQQKLGMQGDQFNKTFGLDSRKLDMQGDQFNQSLGLDQQKVNLQGKQIENDASYRAGVLANDQQKIAQGWRQMDIEVQRIAAGMGQQESSEYKKGIKDIFMGDMPEATKTKLVSAWNAMYAGSPYLNNTIPMTAFKQG
jgi:hypothetical protein